MCQTLRQAPRIQFSASLVIQCVECHHTLVGQNIKEKLKKATLSCGQPLGARQEHLDCASLCPRSGIVEKGTIRGGDRLGVDVENGDERAWVWLGRKLTERLGL